MEAILTSGAEDHLIEGLSFKPPSATANYVLETRQVTYQAESGNRFDPVSSRVIRFRLADHGFLEASSVKMALTLQNQGDQPITPCGQLMSLFRRARLFASSQLVEDRIELATETSITDRLKDGLRRMNDSIEQHPHDAFNANTYTQLGAGKSRRLLSSTSFGVLNQSKWIPLHLVSGGLILEFELDDAATAFDESAVSFEITDVKLFANLHTIDSALANSYASHVLKGNPLHLHYSSVVASRHLVTGSNFTISLVRGFTRLKQCFIVFVKAGQKKTKTFHSPFNGTYNTDVDDFTWQIQIGSRKWPERPCRGIAESWMRLRQAAGSFYGTSDHSIASADYANGCYILGNNFEKVDSMASHSGYSTKDGSIVQLTIENSGLTAGDACLIYQVYDGLLSIQDGSCSVFE